MLKNELFKALKNRKTQYFIVFIVAAFFLFYGSYMLNMFGKTSIELFAQEKMGIVRNYYFQNLIAFLLLVFPVVSFGLYADSFMVENESGCLDFYLIRVSSERYRFYKGMAVVIINFCLIFLIFLFFEVMSWIAIPDIGVKPDYGGPSYAARQGKIFLNHMAYAVPHLYNVLIIFMVAFLCTCEGIIGYACSILLRNEKRIYMYAGLLVAFSLLNILLPVDYQLVMYIQLYPAKTLSAVITLSLWLGISILMFIIGIKKCIKNL